MTLTDTILFLAYNNAKADNVLMQSVNKSKTIDMKCVLKPINKFEIAFRRFMLDHSIPGMCKWLGEWVNSIDKYKLVVMAASRYTPNILRWIHQRYPKIRLINYYWDKISISGYPIEYSRCFENWSFDFEDSVKYGFKYNPQFFSRHIHLDNTQLAYDVSFIGADREGKWPERVFVVNNIYEILKNNRFRLHFHLVTHDDFSNKEITSRKRITEGEFLEVVAKSKVILDIVKENDGWMTLRPLLALSNEKKVITNYGEIINYKFYDKKNIFILGVDNMDNLTSFINSPFSADKGKELLEYEVEEWADRFIRDESRKSH